MTGRAATSRAMPGLARTERATPGPRGRPRGSSGRAVVVAGTLALALASAPFTGCDRSPDAAEGSPGDEPAPTTAMPTNRVDVPPPVRRNLGITFVAVERRAIERTLRVPGRFEYVPTARREHRTMLPGRVELAIEQFDRVEPGDVLYRIVSPEWTSMQRTLDETELRIDQLETRLGTFEPLLEAHARHEAGLAETVALWTERIEELRSLRAAGGGRAGELTEARAALAAARTELADVQEKDAMLTASRAETDADLRAARRTLESLIDAASSLLEIDRSTFVQPVPTDDGERPRWTTIDVIEVRAKQPGVVESIGVSSGAWAERESTVLTTVRPERLRFHAHGLQSDLGVLADGLPARIVPPTPTSGGRSIPLQETMDGTLEVGLAGDPDDRSIDLYVVPETLRPWARAGVAAHLEIVTDRAADTELAVPLAAVQTDGLVPVIFRRDLRDPDVAIRMEADLGRDDGRWVEILSGLADGDEVVLDGSFQLMLATSRDGDMPEGGHFHADGTFHVGDDH